MINSGEPKNTALVGTLQLWWR